MPDKKHARAARKRNGGETRRKILDTAIDEFVRHGFSGARVERIVERVGCNMRMIYHHFGNKEGLYVAALEQVYEEIREGERLLDLSSLDPLSGIQRLLDFTFEHFARHPSFVAMTRNENLLGGRYIPKSSRIAAMSSPLMTGIASLLRRGAQEGLFRRGIDPLQLYVSIVALACHHMNNYHTLSATFRVDMADPKWLAQRQKHVREMILTYLSAPGHAGARAV
jgi:AcrR family transcriptional regulator